MDPVVGYHHPPGGLGAADRPLPSNAPFPGRTSDQPSTSASYLPPSGPPSTSFSSRADQPSTSAPYPHPSGANFPPGTGGPPPPYGPPPPQGYPTPQNQNQNHNPRFSHATSWQQAHFDSGFQSMAPSQAPSVMSFAGSEMSMTSVMTDCTSVNGMSDQMTARFERVKTFYMGSDPAKSKEAVHELMALLEDNDEEVVLGAIAMVRDLARSDNWRPDNVPRHIDRSDVVFTVQRVLNRHRGNKAIVRCCLAVLFFTPDEILVQLMREKREEVLDAVIDGTTILEHTCYRNALLLLNNLMHLRDVGESVVQYVRERKAISFIAPWLGEAHLKDKLVSIVVDSIAFICHRNEEQRSFFVTNLGGIQKLINILRGRTYVPLTNNVVKLLLHIAANDPNKALAVYSQKMVEAGLLEIIHTHLAITDPRLNILAILRLVQYLSDLHRTGDIGQLLYHLIHYIPHPDLRVKKACVECLVNLIANKSDYKAFVTNERLVDYIISLLCETSASTNPDLIVEKIDESAIATLSHLSANHKFASSVIRYLPSTPLRDILLRKLIGMRPCVLKPTLTLLSRLTADRENLPILLGAVCEDAQEKNVQAWYVTALCKVLSVSSFQINEEVEDVKIHALVRSSLETLINICVGDRQLADTVFTSLLHRSPPGTFIPVDIVARPLEGEAAKVKISALRLLAELAFSPQAAAYFNSTPSVQAALNVVKMDASKDLVTLARVVFDRIQDTNAQAFGGGAGGVHPPVYDPQYYGNTGGYSTPYDPSAGTSTAGAYPDPFASLYPGGTVYDTGTGPMSIGAPPVVPVDCVKHEELAYLTPGDDPSLGVYSLPQRLPPDGYTGTLAPEPSPYTASGEAMQWSAS